MLKGLIVGRFGFLAALVLQSSACTTEYPLGTVHQSHFTYPDSLVTPIRNASGSASASSFGGMVIPTGEMKEEAIDNALGTVPEANVLLNYHETLQITVVPFFNSNTTTYLVEGVAAVAEAK